jgi:hypothetical protein
MKCTWCGIKVPEVPEDATLEEQLCNECFDLFVEESGEYEDDERELFNEIRKGEPNED